jgi:transposase-like protein
MDFRSEAMKVRIRRGDPARQQRWQAAIERWRSSGESVRAFCRQEGIQESAFFFWRRRLAPRNASDATSPSPLPHCRSRKTAPPARQSPPAARFLPVEVVAERDPRMSFGVEIVLGSGRVVRVPPRFDRQTLEERAGWIAAERQDRSRPLLSNFHAWLEAESPKVLPKSDIRGAMDHTLNNLAALSVYPNDGLLDIDNNEGENAVRGIALRRKNWLFCGSDRGGRAAAIHFSLLASCKRHGHDPWVYLRDVRTRLPTMLPAAREEELLSLLPHLWKPA